MPAFVTGCDEQAGLLEPVQNWVLRVPACMRGQDQCLHGRCLLRVRLQVWYVHAAHVL